jgi:hypothetical protein
VLGFPEYKLYVGFRAGSSNRRYSISPGVREGRGYIKSPIDGHSFEGGIQVSYQVLRFLAVQAELAFTHDTASLELRETKDNTLISLNDYYRSSSMLIPLTVKGTLQFYDRLVLNPFAGLYFTAPLGNMEARVWDNKKSGGYQYGIPLGWTAGAELGWAMGKGGTVFLDLRYSADFGYLKWTDAEPVYRRSMVSITAGYRYGFFKRKPKPVRDNLPEDFDNGAFNGEEYPQAEEW